MDAENNNIDKILLVLTGGTICSFSDYDGKKKTDTKKAERLIKKIFSESNSKYNYVDFEDKLPMNILSENMTLDRWNQFIKELKTYNMEGYRGVIILHGTDTLAYTSSMLSLILAGLKVPVFMVSSQLPLTEEAANGNANFRVAVELIMNGIKPNVYVSYRNMDGKMFVHLGSHLTQCPNHSNDFSSLDPWCIEDVDNPYLEGKCFESDEMLLYKIKEFRSSVLKITPYVGLDYRRIRKSGVKAVVHGTYHSQTLCVEKDSKRKIVTNYSVFKLKKCFNKKNIDKIKVPLFLEPCNYEIGKRISCYETTADVVSQGAVPTWGMTGEMVYVKAIVGVALGYRGYDLKNFVLNKKINYEIHF